MADEKEIRRLVEQYNRQTDIEGGKEKRAGANPPNKDQKRPAPPTGSGRGSETNQARPNKGQR